uniref:Uncharacterized protein n=1 Tax=Oryzias latipes TaxID=8090 RepID=A0A3B3HJL7_ORYLA
MTSFTEQIVNCGYTGPINEERKDSIIRAIVLHAKTKRTPMLSQLRQGLDVYNFLKVIESNPEHCRGLFVAGNILKFSSSNEADPEDHNELTDISSYQKENLLKIVVRFDHNCFDNMPGHTICFPVVSASGIPRASTGHTFSIPSKYSWTLRIAAHLKYVVNFMCSIMFIMVRVQN